MKSVTYEFSQEEIDYMHGKLDVQELLSKHKALQSRLAAQEAELKALRELLDESFSIYGKPKRHEWLNQTAYGLACDYYNRVRLALDAARKEGK